MSLRDDAVAALDAACADAASTAATAAATQATAAQALLDQASIDALTAQIADLQAQLAQRPPPFDLLAALKGSGSVTIPAGLYRVTSPLVPAKTVTRIIADGVVIDGSAVLTGWAAQTGGRWYLDGALPKSYTDVGAQDIAAETTTGPYAFAGRWREQMWADGVYLTRVMSLDQLVPGAFYQDYTANRIWLADDPTKHLVEMAVASAGLNINQPGLTVQGLTVQRCANPSQTGAVNVNRDATLIDVNTRWNHARGLSMNNLTAATVVHGGSDYENDQLGAAKYKCVGTVIESRSFIRNNPHGIYHILDWESGGFKWVRSVGGQTNDCVAVGNRGVGMWFDIANDGEIIQRARISGNSADGHRDEISHNCKLLDSTLTGNCLEQTTARGASPSLMQGAEVNVHDSDGSNEIARNMIVATLNGIVTQARKRTLDGKPMTLAVSVHDNDVTVTNGTSGTASLNGGDVSRAVFAGNTWRGDRPMTANGKSVSLAQWVASVEPTARSS